MKRIKSKKDQYIELTEVINCIPAGVYKVEHSCSDSIQLSVSDKIMLGLIGDYKNVVKYISKNEWLNKRKSRDCFLDEYYRLMDGLRCKIPDWSKPFTFCFLDPSLVREIH